MKMQEKGIIIAGKDLLSFKAEVTGTWCKFSIPGCLWTKQGVQRWSTGTCADSRDSFAALSDAAEGGAAH